MTLIEDPEADFQGDDWEARLHRPDEGVLAYAPTPRGRSTDWAGRDLLRALGKDLTLSGSHRNAFRRFEDACAWAAAHAVNHIVISPADDLMSDGLRVLIEASLVTDAHLILVVHRRLRRGAKTEAAQWGPAIATFSLLKSLERAPRTQNPVAHETTTAPLPPDEFPTFLNALEAVCSPNQLQEATRAYAAACDTTARWLQEHPGAGEAEVAELMRGLVLDHSEPLLCVSALRGAQAMLLLAGICTKVDVRRLLIRDQRRAQSLSERDTAALLRYGVPRYAAIPAVQLSLGLLRGHLSELTMTDASPDGRKIRTDGRWHSLPEPVALSVRAQLLHRFYNGADESAALFADGQGHPMNLQAHQRLAARVTQEVGVVVATEWTPRTSNPAVRWTHRRGISIKRITSP